MNRRLLSRAPDFFGLRGHANVSAVGCGGMEGDFWSTFEMWFAGEFFGVRGVCVAGKVRMLWMDAVDLAGFLIGVCWTSVL